MTLPKPTSIAVLAAGFVSFIATGSLAFGGAFTPNVMGPLSVGDMTNPNGDASTTAWQNFEQELQLMKNLGIYAVSTDVWWGAVEGAGDGQFNWTYYDKMSDEIIAAGLKWVPIFSFHQCGGNVGDTCNIPIPSWIWTKYIGTRGITTADDLKYQSEEDHLSSEVVSVWGDSYVIGDYARFMTAFQAHFANKASSISEVNISLGPSGELRYPSYNQQDPDAGYPTRGRLQAYSNMAMQSFKAFMIQKYGSQATNTSPPNDGTIPYANDFFANQQQYTQYGMDFFDWYSGSLITHGKTVLQKAISILDAPGSAFQGIPIGAKIPGVHWRMAIDRSAELAAGLIRTSSGDLNDDSRGHGYEEIISLFQQVATLAQAPQITLHFTCLEMSDGSGGPAVGSLAKSLVFWVAAEAHRLGVPIKGENALSGAVSDPNAWQNIDDAVTQAGYEGLTVLRMDDIYQSQLGQQSYHSLIDEML
jgi:beta-amylase